ncbi:hypothetical protein ACFLXU_02330 [Chloroflexota bacterium]
MGGFKETCIAIGVIFLGIVALIEGLILLDLVVYISMTGNTFSDKVAVAYDGAYDGGYDQAYNVAYQEAYDGAYSKGLEKGYEVGFEINFKEGETALVELHNPTHGELREFLIHDDTDSKSYISGEYVCFDFAAELNNQAEASGIRAAYVRIRSKEWGHAVVAFETVDRGIIFIEPQSDREIRLVIGEPYPWYSAGADRPMDYYTPIVEIQSFW